MQDAVFTFAVKLAEKKIYIHEKLFKAMKFLANSAKLKKDLTSG